MTHPVTSIFLIAQGIKADRVSGGGPHRTERDLLDKFEGVVEQGRR